MTTGNKIKKAFQISDKNTTQNNKLENTKMLSCNKTLSCTNQHHWLI